MAPESSTAPAATTTGSLPSAVVAPTTAAKEERVPRWVEIVPVVFVLAALLFFPVSFNWFWWVSSRETQETDDAYVRADLTPLSTRVSGTVAEVAVNDYQKVKAGDLLVQLKDEDYRAQVEQAEAGIEAAKAQVAQAQAGIEASMAQIKDAEAAVEATRADVVRTEAERHRQESLIEAGAVTRQHLEQVVAEADRFRANLAGREAALAQALAGL